MRGGGTTLLCALHVLLAICLSHTASADMLSGNHGQKFQWPTDESLKIKLTIDPYRYRSASQGPRMADESVTEEEIDSVVEHATRTHGWNSIIPQYSGRRSWAWRQWSGTITELLWRTSMFSALVPLMLIVAVNQIDPSVRWFGTPDATHALIVPLLSISHGWNYLLTLTTFVTTFFLGHSHEFWRKCYTLSRIVQGRMNDIGLLCASHAQRTVSGDLTPASAAFIKDMARELRLCHVLFWADTCYRGNVDFGGSIRVLLSEPAIDRLLQRGLLNEREHAALHSSALPPSRWYMLVLEWITSRIVTAHREGVLVGGAGSETILLSKCCELRAACMGIPDELAARMPLAYVHFTHLLVDALLFLAPFALYPKLGAFSVVLNVLFSLFYRGLLELSKSFLDPFGNRRVSRSSLSSDIAIATLIGESNAGSIVWPQGAFHLPFRFNKTADVSGGGEGEGEGGGGKQQQGEGPQPAPA